MAVLLGVDASSALGHVAALWQDGVLTPADALAGRPQTQSMLPMLATLLKDAGLMWPEVDALVLGVGPGRFTGLRVSACLIQALAMGLALPVLRVSSLQVMALATSMAHPGLSQVCVVNDAHMGEVYVGRYALISGGVQPIEADVLMRPQDLSSMHLPTNCAVVGDAWATYPEAMQALRAQACWFSDVVRPEASALLTLGLAAWEAGEGVPYTQALPNYVRGANAWRRAQ